GGKEVAAVNGEGSVEEEGQRRQRQGRGNGSGGLEESAHHVGRDRQEHRTHDGGQFEGHRKVDDVGGQRGKIIWQYEVVGVGRHAREPSGIPRCEIEDVALRVQIGRQGQVRTVLRQN